MLWWRAKSITQRFLIVTGISLLVLVLFGFSRRIAEFSRLSTQLDREVARITELSATQAYLDDRIAYATSEAAVEEWAREQARLAQEGDFPIIPLPAGEVTPETQSAAEVQASTMSNWELWMTWLFSN